jgi:methenyltetrahydrofolate cyclohydrolase
MAESPLPLQAPLGEVVDRLAHGQPAPGGGSAAAAAVAMSAALTSSVASMSRDAWAEAPGAIAQAEAIRRRALPLVDRDAGAYEDAVRALAERRANPSGDRDARLGAALADAAAVPLEIGEVGADAAELAAEVADRGAGATRADATVAVVLAEAAVRAAACLVEINLGTIAGDPRLAAARGLLARAAAARERALLALSG